MPNIYRRLFPAWQAYFITRLAANDTPALCCSHSTAGPHSPPCYSYTCPGWPERLLAAVRVSALRRASAGELAQLAWGTTRLGAPWPPRFVAGLLGAASFRRGEARGGGLSVGRLSGKRWREGGREGGREGACHSTPRPEQQLHTPYIHL
jgi:hypothetical protein